MKKIVVILLLLMVFGATQSWAMNYPLGNWASEKAKSDSYGTRWMGMFVGGVDQIVTSPIELVYHPWDHIVNQKHYATGLFTGLGEGLVKAVQDIGSGVVNIVGSPIPGYHGVWPATETATT